MNQNYDWKRDGDYWEWRKRADNAPPEVIEVGAPPTEKSPPVYAKTYKPPNVFMRVLVLNAVIFFALVLIKPVVAIGFVVGVCVWYGAVFATMSAMR